jgi:YD repeat-containing protein
MCSKQRDERELAQMRDELDRLISIRRAATGESFGETYAHVIEYVRNDVSDLY